MLKIADYKTGRLLKVALLGLGNVGRAFFDYAGRQGDRLGIRLDVCGVADSSGGLLARDRQAIETAVERKASGRSISEFAPGDVIRSAAQFVNELPGAGVSVLIESLPTSLADGQPALDLVCAALGQGTNVVTVDKGPLVHGYELMKEAMSRGGSRLGFSGTTGVSPPGEVTGDRVLEIRGVLNGTTNYILTEIQERSVSFNQALATAQSEGIAEPDPSLDIEGWDTASKMLILAKALMGADSGIFDVSRIGIGPETESLIETARERNAKVRLIGRARIWQGRVRVSVAPKIVAADSPFYPVSGTSKAALFRTEAKGEVLAFARSGRDAISRIIADDLLRVIDS
jgi:homoserine dehydrogenase